MKESEVLQPVLDEIDYLSMGPEADKEKAMVLLRENEETVSLIWRKFTEVESIRRLFIF